MQRFEAGNDHAQQLDDDGSRDVRHNAQREDRQLQHGATREEVDQADEVLRNRAHLADALLNDLDIHTRRWDERTDTVDDDHTKHEEDFVPQLLGLEGLD